MWIALTLAFGVSAIAVWRPWRGAPGRATVVGEVDLSFAPVPIDVEVRSSDPTSAQGDGPTTESATRAPERVAVARIAVPLESWDGEFEVTCNALDNDVLGYFADAESTSKLSLLRDRTARIVRSAGRARGQGGPVSVPVPELPSPAGWCIWVTEAAAEPRVSIVPDGAIAVGALAPVRSAPPAWIAVRDSRGAPVVDAIVVQQAMPVADIRPVDAPLEVRARRALVRESRTDSTGRVPRIPMGGPSWIEARKGDEFARVITDGEQRDITLLLGQSFTVEGSVGVAAGPWATVTIHPVIDEPGPPIAACAVGDDGTFGPFDVPLIADARAYVAKLDHGTVIPEERTFGAPSAGNRVTIRFAGLPGLAYWIFVSDAETGQPIAAADVMWTWTGGSARQVSGTEGYAGFGGLPAALALLTVRAQGYADFVSEPIDLSDDSMPELFHIALQRPGRIVGVVDFGSEKPQGFLIQYGFEGTGSLEELVKFPRAVSGDFSIEGLAPGRYALQGVLADRRATTLAHVVVEPGVETSQDLSILPTLSVKGRVVDAVDRTPIADAQVAVVVMGAGAVPLATLEDEWRTDADGRFEVPGAPLANGGVIVSAEGFRAGVQLVPEGNPAGVAVDLGLLPLEPHGYREVLLVGDVTDPSSYSAAVARHEGTVKPFGPDGRVLLAGTARGTGVELRHPDGVIDSYLVYGDADATETLELHVDERKIRLEFEYGASAVDRSAFGDLRLYWTDPGGRFVSRALLGRALVAIEMPGVVGDELYVHATSSQGHQAVAVFTSPFDRMVIDFTVPRIEVVVLGIDGGPCAGARVSIDAVRGTRLLGQQTRFTDERGRATFAPNPVGDTWVIVEAIDAGDVLQRRVELPGEGQPIVVRLREGRAIRARLLDDGASVANARWAVRPLVGPYVARTGVTDAAGALVADDLDSDPVVLEVHPAGAWMHVRRVTAGEPPVELGVHRRCGLKLRAVNGEGVPIAGARVSLVHTAIDQYDRTRGHLGGDVAAWMAAGLVPAVGLVTGLGGELELRALPEGTYRCRVDAGSGYVEAEIVLAPGNQAPVVVVLS